MFAKNTSPASCASLKSNQLIATCALLHFNLQGSIPSFPSSLRGVSVVMLNGSTAVKKHKNCSHALPSKLPSHLAVPANACSMALRGKHAAKIHRSRHPNSNPAWTTSRLNHRKVASARHLNDDDRPGFTKSHLSLVVYFGASMNSPCSALVVRSCGKPCIVPCGVRGVGSQTAPDSSRQRGRKPPS